MRDRDPSRALALPLVLALSLGGVSDATARPQDRPPSGRDAADLIADLTRDPVDIRRAAALAIAQSGPDIQRSALPALVDALRGEKDGQVRLAVLDALTALGPDAEPAVSALVQAMRSDLGGSRREKSHQDYRAALALAAVGAPAVDGLRELLGAEREHLRAEAAMALGRIGPDASAAVPDLLLLLSGRSDRVRLEAAIALGRLGPDATGPLIDALASDDPTLRAGAAEALGHSAEPTDQIIEVLRDRSRDEDPRVRASAITAIGRLSPPDPILLVVLDEAIRDEDEAVRLASVNLLTGRPTLLRAMVPTLSGLLASEDGAVARHASFALQLLGPEAAPLLLDALRAGDAPVEPIAEALAQIGRPITAMLSEAVGSPEPRVRRGAALALGSIRPLDPSIVPILSAGLRDTDPQVRAAFLAAVGELGPRGRAAVPEVRAMLRDESAAIRLLALDILVRSAPRDDRLIGDLTALIGDLDPEVVRTAIDALRSLGPIGRSALPEVIGTLQGSPPEVRRAAAALIASHGQAASEALPALASMLADPEPEFRALAARTLGELGPAAQPAFDGLAPLLDDEDVDVRAASALALGGIGIDAESVRPLLSRALLDDDGRVRGAARGAIQRLGPTGIIFVPELILTAAKGDDVRMVERSLRRFERTGPDARSIPELVEQLAHEQEPIRLLATRFLGLAGPAARDALPALEQLRDDPSTEVREQAEAARSRIGGESPPPSPRRRGGAGS